MSKHPLIQTLEKEYLKSDIPKIRIGDTVTVEFKIVEGNKERMQAFTGTVIGRKGSGINETLSLHRVVFGEGMERVFPLHSPRIGSIKVIRSAKVGRAKRYDLRGKMGKAAKTKADMGTVRKATAAASTDHSEEGA